MFRSARFVFAAWAALNAFVSAGCSGAGASPIDGAAGAEPAASGEGSRGPASGSRPGAAPPGPDPGPAAARGPLFRAAADRDELAAFTLDEAVIAQDGAARIGPGGHPGTDPQPSGYHGGSFYNGGSFRYATVTSPTFVAGAPFDSVTPSFEASTPPGTWIEVKVAARVGGSWTKDYNLGVWAEDTGTVRRHSVAGQGDALGDVDTDTLELAEPADALRLRVVLFSESTATPVLRAASAIATKRGASAPEPLPVKAAWGKTLPVPKRSQMIYPGGGEVWCSPTSTSMLLSYWADALSAPALHEAPPEAATRCHDVVYGGTGNWPFNTAHASALGGGRLHGIVTRLSSIAQLERLVAAGVPAAISVRYGPGELARAPITSTAGHLVVVAGFTEDGDVVCNDPAFASDASVEVVYARAALFTAWQRSLGTTYVLWPSGTSLPTDPLGAYR